MILPADKTPVYLDYNATAPIRAEVIEAVAAVMGTVGNPSSVHACGRWARRQVEDARAKFAELLAVRAQDVVFTSGGTEANNLALRGAGRVRLIVSAGEHDSVLAAAGAQACRVPLRACGRVDLDRLSELIGPDGGDALVSVMVANNETGVIQPVREVIALCHARGALCHCDGVQALGKLSLAGLKPDFLTLSAHKIGGPQGVGALVLGRGGGLVGQQLGGAQERHRRGGTENVAGIVGFGQAVALICAEQETLGRIRTLRDKMEQRIQALAPMATVFGQAVARLPNSSCIVMPGVGSDMQVMAMDLDGIAVSSGAACSSGKVQPSHVLRAMGVTEEDAGSVLRVSLGWDTTQSDIDRFVESWAALYDRKGRKSG